jgi:hypothetical protein
VRYKRSQQYRGWLRAVAAGKLGEGSKERCQRSRIPSLSTP